ncbi:granzyme B(G,H)-like [Pundamilia nyererei]|uniref:trypsin n=1 Tax=Pundamilia nyererei TaxID=303518 RepID=A0A3B4H1F0_9CICH|nr:PREDICTED: granzyme B(G,H)-like [Pundamilia nyererei]
MFIHCNLAALILVLTLHDQVHTGEIVGGHKVAPHSRPYMVILELNKSNGITTYCDGFLVNEHFVMTAAHCEARLYKVFLGLHDYKNRRKVQTVTVDETNAFPHEGYNKTSFKNDIMLLKLHPKAKFNEKVTSITLAGRDDVPKSCAVLGWGKTENGKASDVLREVNVNLTDNELCAKEKKYCSKGTTGPSNGDSGGPLVCECGTAYGVVSASQQNTYSYTMIPEYRDWIDCILKHK